MPNILGPWTVLVVPGYQGTWYYKYEKQDDIMLPPNSSTVLPLTRYQVQVFWFVCYRDWMHSAFFQACRRRYDMLGAMLTHSTCSSLRIVQIPCLNDNYGYLIHDDATGQTAAVDTPDATAYKQELDKRGWKLSHIFNTHQWVLSAIRW